MAKSASQVDQHRARSRREQRGFTLIEVLMAIIILVVGVVAVAQLVPASVGSNSTNRNDSSALVFAQRQMDLFLGQPLNGSGSSSFNETIDGQTFTCYLGNPLQPNQQVGSGVVVTPYNQVIVDFTAGTVPNYSFVYHDPNDPAEVVYDVRWAVITVTNNGLVTSKRFLVGVRKKGGNGIYPPVTLDTILSK